MSVADVSLLISMLLQKTACAIKPYLMISLKRALMVPIPYVDSVQKVPTRVPTRMVEFRRVAFDPE
jgi:hypothetical protein|tara:strand:+ start:6524 stop:6721 length:198 start_codon:yes stop_codon:yes gene_type:complete